MKNKLTKKVSKKVYALFLAALLCGASLQSFALPDNKANKAADIVYKGMQDNKLVFTVNYSNELAQPFQLVVKNDQNEILYARQFDGKPLNTRMLFTEVPQNCKLTFLIRTGKKEVAQAFEINTQVKTVEEFIVKG